MAHKIKRIILLAGDISLLYISLFLTLLIRYKANDIMMAWSDHWRYFSLIFIGWLIIFYIFNLYNIHFAVNNEGFFEKTYYSLLISALLSVSFFYLNPQIDISPKRNLLLFIVVFTILFSIWRIFFNSLLKTYLPKNKIAIIGVNEQTKDLIDEIKKKPHLGYQVSFVIDENGINTIDGIPVYNNIYNLDKLIMQNKISSLILNINPHKSEHIRTSLFNCLHLEVNFTNLPNFYEQLTGKIPTSVISQVWFLENLSEGDKRLFDSLKRFYDVVLALIILLITFPFWPIIGILLKIENKEPVFITQTRIGRHGKPFKIIKFRSMISNQDSQTPTQEKDPRITKAGAFIRLTRIDEIPQMLNILKGDMSFVGPRPERPELIKNLAEEIPFYNERTLVKPGITGWDQVSGEYHSPSLEDTIKKIQYDLFYIKNRSIYLDLSIFLKTIYTILSKGGR